MRLLANFFAIMAVLMLSFVGWLAFQPEHDVKDATGSSEPGRYSDLTVVADEDGSFDGTITIQNVHDMDVLALVSVNLYLGDENVGELSGDVVLKPDSKSSVDLLSFDNYVEYDEARVDLDLLPH